MHGHAYRSMTLDFTGVETKKATLYSESPLCLELYGGGAGPFKAKMLLSVAFINAFYGISSCLRHSVRFGSHYFYLTSASPVPSPSFSPRSKPWPAGHTTLEGYGSKGKGRNYSPLSFDTDE